MSDEKVRNNLTAENQPNRDMAKYAAAKILTSDSIPKIIDNHLPPP